MLPPIRYPLPSLITVALSSLLAWQCALWSREWRSEMAARARLALEGPPVPSSDRPRVLAGSINRRALLLHDETSATGRPGGSVVETIDRRMFFDVYDTWPEPGPATHVRVGNRRPIGWVQASDVLPWDTRLVVRSRAGRLAMADTPGGPATSVDLGTMALPVLGWTDRAVEVAAWDPGHPWSRVVRRGWVGLDDLPPDFWGVWISQVELPVLLRLTLEGDPSVVRLRAILGRLTDSKPMTRAEIESARPALPAVVFARASDPRRSAARLAEANAHFEGEAGWSGLSFRFLLLGDLPGSP